MFSWSAAAQTVTVWQNGAIAATAPNVASLPVGTGVLVLAYPIGSGCTYFDGAADDLRIYSRALSQADVDLLYNLD